PSRQANFAPDGVSLAFIQSDGRADDLYVGRIDTTGQPRLVNVQQVATGTIAEPVWSPDGMALAYIAVTNRQFQLWVRSIGRTADGTLELGQPHQITHGDGIDATSRPVWLTGALAAEMPSWLKAVN
ncbi:MAG TPA: hypothetical protein VKX96_04060, partial [Chloroflexota bacterium]|nr:hypothetical protein [Chloroflexota bacterium]